MRGGHFKYGISEILEALVGIVEFFGLVEVGAVDKGILDEMLVFDREAKASNE
jgi:hypothetical protein